MNILRVESLLKTYGQWVAWALNGKGKQGKCLLGLFVFIVATVFMLPFWVIYL